MVLWKPVLPWRSQNNAELCSWMWPKLLTIFGIKDSPINYRHNSHFFTASSCISIYCSFQFSHGVALSPCHAIRVGIFQNSVLGPILYVLYIVDVQFTQWRSNLIVANDTALLPTSDSLETAAKAIQEHLDCITKWWHLWKIQFNPVKLTHISTLACFVFSCYPKHVHNQC